MVPVDSPAHKLFLLSIEIGAQGPYMTGRMLEHNNADVVVIYLGLSTP